MISDCEEVLLQVRCAYVSYTDRSYSRRLQVVRCMYLLWFMLLAEICMYFLHVMFSFHPVIYPSSVPAMLREQDWVWDWVFERVLPHNKKAQGDV